MRHRDIRLASAVGMRKSNRALAEALSRMKNGAQRLKLQHLCDTLSQFEDPHLLWKASTQGGRIKTIDVLRQTIREASATVTIALRLSDGRTRIERNRLRRSGASWVIDIIEMLENNEMHPTRSAPAGNRGPRG